MIGASGRNRVQVFVDLAGPPMAADHHAKPFRARPTDRLCTIISAPTCNVAGPSPPPPPPRPKFWGQQKHPKGPHRPITIAPLPVPRQHTHHLCTQAHWPGSAPKVCFMFANHRRCTASTGIRVLVNAVASACACARSFIKDRLPNLDVQYQSRPAPPELFRQENRRGDQSDCPTVRRDNSRTAHKAFVRRRDNRPVALTSRSQLRTNARNCASSTW